MALIKKQIGKGLVQTYLQRRCTDGQQVYVKTFNISNHQENASQNYIDVRYYLTYVRKVIIKKIRK